MTTEFKVGRLDCMACRGNGERVVYILYPMDLLSGWIEEASLRHGVSIVVVTGMDWDNDLTPWPAKGVPKGSPDFKGYSARFLETLRTWVIPEAERRLGMTETVSRDLVGVSLSGLFTLWQWLTCDEFHSIASLSGSFWYEGFADWVTKREIPHKTGSAYFLLGSAESKTKVKAFASVADDTRTVIETLRHAGIRTIFETVPGNHYTDPIPRLERALIALTPDDRTTP